MTYLPIMTYGMAPAKYPEGAQTVHFGRHGYVTGWVRQDDSQTTVTDIWNGNESVIDNCDIRSIGVAR